MLPLLQVVTKNDLLKRKASIFLEQMFVKYGIDIRSISYADLSPLFKNAPGFIIKKFELDKKLSSEDMKEFKGLCEIKKSIPPKPAPIPTPVTTTPVQVKKPKVTYPINRPKRTGKTK